MLVDSVKQNMNSLTGRQESLYIGFLNGDLWGVAKIDEQINSILINVTDWNFRQASLQQLRGEHGMEVRAARWEDHSAKEMPH